jgi:hypothetical protein
MAESTTAEANAIRRDGWQHQSSIARIDQHRVEERIHISARPASLPHLASAALSERHHNQTIKLNANFHSQQQCKCMRIDLEPTHACSCSCTASMSGSSPAAACHEQRAGSNNGSVRSRRMTVVRREHGCNVRPAPARHTTSRCVVPDPDSPIRLVWTAPVSFVQASGVSVCGGPRRDGIEQAEISNNWLVRIS